MKNILSFCFLVFLMACSSSDTPTTEKAGDDDEMEEVSSTIVSPGNVSDIAIYQSAPYFQDNAGYQGADFGTLPSNRDLTFTHVSGKSDSQALNEMITSLSALGGGKILIEKGDYKFKEVYVESNIHITIAAETIIDMDNSLGGKNFLFNLGFRENLPRVENVRIVGLGTTQTRPKLKLTKFNNTFYRAMAIGYIKDLLIENFTIEDELTKGSAIALNPVEVDADNANIAENVTVANIEMRGASIGYGLAQTNVGKNILLKNLSCQGGMTCRIEAHTGRQYDLGVDNIVIKNVASIHGKAAVLLQPHSVLNGRVLVDLVKAEGSSWTLFLKEGFVGSDSKRREKGNFAPSSTFTNISLESTDDTATLSFKNFDRYISDALIPLYKTPDFTYIPEDANHNFSSSGVLSNEAPIVGPSVATIFIDASYTLNIPAEKDILLTGKTENRVKILDRR